MVDYTTLLIIYYPVLSDKDSLQIENTLDDKKIIYQHSQMIFAAEKILQKKCLFYRRNNDVYAESNMMEPEEIEKILLEIGFKQKDFNLSIAYRRKWGVL